MATNVSIGTYTPPAIPKDRIDITLGVFFDGTGNNKNNTNERKANSAVFQKHGLDNKYQDTSYYNDWSNVARLWDNYDKNNSVYIDGIGTESKKSDSKIGYGLGTGKTGVRGKVRIGCEGIAEKVKEIKKNQNAKKIGTLTFNVFGFSRGAAAARNFVYEIGKAKYSAIPQSAGQVGAIYYTDADGYPSVVNELPRRGHLGLKLQEAGIVVDIVKVRFLGIYDTVSLYGLNFNNDVTELHLNEISLAKNVVHFVAENEHRENFDLTKVHVGIEKKFPGVHSDIGGGYNTGEEIVEEIETSWPDKRKLEPLRKQLIAEGWYKDAQLKYRGGKAYWALEGIRDLKKDYSYIPLQFMAEYCKNSQLPVDIDQITKNRYSISNNALLVRVKARLKSYVMGNGTPYTFKWYNALQKQSATYQKELAEQADLRELRNKYLHWSSNRGGGRWGIGLDPTSDRKRVTH